MSRRASGARAAVALAALACATGRAAPGLAPDRDGAVWAFTAPWDPRSDSSVSVHAAALDAVVTGWIALDTAAGTDGARRLYADPVADGRRHPAAMTIVTSWLGDRFHPETVRRLAGDEDALARTAATVARIAGDGGYRGVVLDLEGQEPEDLGALLRVAGAIGDSVRARGAGPVALAIPATDTAAYPAAPLLRVADFLLVMLYDEHWAGSVPGPTASPEWARRWLAVRAAEVPASRLIAGLPLYGYRWSERGEPARAIGWREAQRAAAAAGATLARDPATFTMTAASPGAWELWATDAPLVERLMADARALGVRRVAFWRLGLEDPAVWTGPLAR